MGSQIKSGITVGSKYHNFTVIPVQSVVPHGACVALVPYLDKVFLYPRLRLGYREYR
jgi:hypothetical protein